MLGFELKHNGQTTKGAVENGVVSISLLQHEGVIHLSLGGLDADLQQHLVWLESIAGESDDISIKVVNIEEPSAAIQVIPQKEETLEDKIEEYKRLERYLQKEGIL